MLSQQGKDKFDVTALTYRMRGTVRKNENLKSAHTKSGKRQALKKVIHAYKKPA